MKPFENNKFGREDLDFDFPHYRLHFHGKPHLILLAENKVKEPSEICCIAVELKEVKCSLKVLVFSRAGWKKTSIISNPKNNQFIKHLGRLDFLSGFKFFVMEQQDTLKKNLLEYETRSISTGYKFGVLYQKPGQTLEEQMYSNEKGSIRYVQFLKLLGNVINTQGHTGFRGDNFYPIYFYFIFILYIFILFYFIFNQFYFIFLKIGGLDVKDNSTGKNYFYFIFIF